MLFHNAPFRKRWELAKASSKIGIMVFQSYHLFPHMTVLENILLGPLKVQNEIKYEALKQAEQLLRKVGLLEKKMPIQESYLAGNNSVFTIVHSLYES